MRIFQFKARNAEGAHVAGSIRAKSEEHAVLALKEAGYRLEDLKFRSPAEKVLDRMQSFVLEKLLLEYFNDISHRFRRVSHRDLSLFFRQMAVLYNSGITLKRILQALEGEVWPAQLSRALLQIGEGLNSGIALHRILDKFPYIFPVALRRIIRVGEESGKLHQALEKAAELSERNAMLHQRITAALVYPACLFVVSMVTTMIIILYILPQLLNVMGTFDQGASWMAARVTSLVSFLSNPLILFIILEILILLWLFYLMWTGTPAGRTFVDRILLRVPVLGKFLLNITMSRLSYNLWMMIDSGVNLVEVLEILPATVGNECVAKVLRKARSEIIQGDSLSDALAEENLISPVFIQMLKVGEESGNLTECLLYVTRFYEQESELAVLAFLAVIEPLIIVFMGLMVGLLLVTFLPVIYQLSKGIG